MTAQPPIIIVVDDNPAFLKSVARLLNVHGLTARTFNSAEALLDQDSIQTATCLLLDIHLGGISGIELQRRLTAAGLSRPVIFMTAIDDDNTRKDRHQSARTPARRAIQDFIAGPCARHKFKYCSIERKKRNRPRHSSVQGSLARIARRWTASTPDLSMAPGCRCGASVVLNGKCFAAISQGRSTTARPPPTVFQTRIANGRSLLHERPQDRVPA
jgi:FixJ family two-component response regulator